MSVQARMDYVQARGQTLAWDQLKWFQLTTEIKGWI